MIFKKIYTFLNNIFNGNSFSKLFLASILILFSSFVAFELKATAPAPTLKNNIESTATAGYVDAGLSPDATNDPTNEFHISYNKAGLQSIKIYTSYLPPKNTYESVSANKTRTEHTLGPCEIIGSSGVDMIGNDCMIKIPFDCLTPPPGIIATEKVNCLKYGNVFTFAAGTDQATINSSKKLNPIECTGTLEDKRTCLSTNKSYCHNIDNPILGINCKLAPCNAIPNQKYRRPGVNCMADCNESNTAKHITENKFFMEGFNCLSSCKTTASPIIGENCVLEFNDYVMPLCNKDNLFPSAKFFNKSSNAFFPREQCLDVIDLPLCASAQTITTNNCVPECAVGNFSGHGNSCINFQTNADSTKYTNKKCHHYTTTATLNANPSCGKLNCHNLSITELARSLNGVDFSIPTISNQKYCIPTKYTNFSFKQFKAINENLPSTAYLRDYKLDNKTCYSNEDTEAIETILSSRFYGGTADTTSEINNKITFLKTQCALTTAISGCTRDIVTRTNSQFNPDFLYDKTSVCKFVNVPEKILCTDYKKPPIGTAPFDCDSKTLCSFANGDCQTSGICSDASQDYCYKNDINCNSSRNKNYKICETLNTSSAKTSYEDPYVSWFFRPTISSKSLIDATGGGKRLLNMTGYPVTSTKDIPHQNDDLYTTISDLDANGKVSNTISNSSEVPGAEGHDAGVRAVGPANICGMNSNFREIPSDDFAYFRGDVKTTYEVDDKISHSVDICIRYVSSSSLTQSCGHRNCLNNCAFIGPGTGICTKICGYDVCKTLSIVEGPKERIRNCASNKQNFIRASYNIGSGTNKIIGFDQDECIKTYETSSDTVSRNTRVRIFKPESSNYICAVAEFTDITTASLSRPYFDGDEFFLVPDGKGGFKKLCVSGTYVQSTNSCENGFDANQMDIVSRVWRTAKIIKYIQEPPLAYKETQGLPAGLTLMSSSHIDPITRLSVNQTIGRVDFNTKRYFETSDCIKHKNRISSPILFSKATLINSERLFLPNVIIEGVCNISKKPAIGQPPAPPVCDNPDIAGKTDFLKPAIKILYGKKGASTDLSHEPLSRFHNYKIIGINNENLNTSTNPVGNEYVIKPFNIGIQDTDRIVKKVTLLKESRYDENSISKIKPVVCLYAKKENPGGVPVVAPAAGAGAGAVVAAAGAVTTPAIDDKGDFIGCIDRKRATTAPIINAKPPVAPATVTNYNNLEFQVGFTANNKSDIQLTNLSNDIKNKSNLRKCVNIESQGYKICIERDECSLLNIECVDNEKSLIDELQNPDQHMLSIPSRQATSNYCKNELLVKCNAKKGLTGANTRYKTLDPDSTYGFNQPASTSYYGWHNEVCVVEGFGNLDDPDKIVYVQKNQAVLSNDAKASCIKKPGLTDAQCASDSCDNTIGTGCTKKCCQIVSPDTDNSRPATPHELGYCVENLNYKNSCPAIKYYEKNSDTSDIYFISPQHLSPVHQSHIDRNANRPINGVAQNANYGNAEYEVAYGGNTNIAGACNGFFKKPISGFPSANCSATGSATGWVFTGFCERYSCQALTIPSYGANISGNYESNYDAATIDGSKKGSSHGYTSNWPETTITDLNKKTISSGAICIAGYKKIGQTTSLTSALRSTQNIPTLSGYQEKIDSLFGAINYNSDGNAPTRNCNQVGEWESVTNPCERIICPALNFPEPTESNAIDLNEFGTVTKLIRPDGKNVIYASKMNSYLGLTKVKFSISTTINGGNIYLNANSADGIIISDTANDFIIKNRDDNNNVSTIQSNQTYVLQKISNYWKILNNSNDPKLKTIWEKSGGALFPSAKAIRSNLFYYNNLPDIEDKHTVTGVCGAGYNQLAGAPPPELTCDSKGNWTLLKNRCVSECKAVNSPVADDPSHGFATWTRANRVALDSKLVNSSACSSGYIPYPYTPIYDDQGVVKYPYKALPSDQGFEKYLPPIPPSTITAETAYDAVTTYSVDTFLATVSSPSPENTEGTYYNLKITQTGSGGGNNLGEKVFYLTNNPLTIQSPSSTKWSKIKFASFGKPTYQSDKATKDTNCHNPLSKYIVAKKCIGNNSCNLQKSEFTSGFTCSSPTNFGNGVSGENDVSGDEFGAMGGNGGGNNSETYNSYYDHKFHDIESKTLPDFNYNENNFGKAVDLNQALENPNQFDGKPGSVIIEEYSDSNFSTRIRIISYIVPQEATSHTISGTAGSGTIIYVKYTIIGGGGGGGGPGNGKGSNGTGGSKIVGYFKVNAGTVLKIYVGDGGKAGKQGNAPSGGGVSSLNPQIIQPIKILNSTKETNFATKVLKRIGEFFVSEAYAYVTSCPDYQYLGNCFQIKCVWSRRSYLCCSEINSNKCTIEYGNKSGTTYCENCFDKTCKLPTTDAGLPRESDGTGKNVSGTGSINCVSIYSGTISYTCTIYGGTANTSGTCVTNSCTLPANTGFPTGASASVTGAGSVTCASGFRSGTTAPTYTCATNGGTATINSGGTCVINSCTLPANTGFPTGASASVSGTGSVTCTSGYKNGPTPPTYTCATNGGTATINTDGTCIPNCNAGQELIGGVCQAVNCTVTANASDPYVTQNILAYTVGSNTGTFDCKEGYYGTVSYTCSRSGEAQNINTTNCIRIQCTLPESGISKVDSGRTVYYAKEEVEYSCASGYRSLIDINKPKYICVGNASKTNPSALTITNECSLITCDFNYAGTTYSLRDAQSQIIACNQSLGYIGSFNISCSDQGLLSSASTNCRMAQCTVPNNLNTSLTSASKVVFTGSTFKEISCQEGYNYSTNCQIDDSSCGIPRYRCLNDSGTINGTFEFLGSCTRIRCDLPSTGDSALNSVLDGTSVDWTGNSFVNTTCKTGFYKGEYEPAYSCYKSGYSTINKCLPITCNLEAGSTYSSRTNLEYGENKIIDCNKEGYSGTITYNCRTPVTSYFQGFPLGTITTSNINCLPISRVRSANNGATFNAYTTSGASAGGKGGEISAGIAFLKGGNGGNSSSFGSGGGGGSASMIAIDNRIIAIAGGGKGGKGGGSSYVSEPASQALQMTQTLYSNVFNNYLMLEMEYSDSSSIGLATGNTSANTFSLASPSGTFFNDIVYSLFGNPVLVEASKSLTPGSCNLNPPSLDVCSGQSSCNLNNVSSLCSGDSCSCSDPNLIALASYSSGKPKLSLTRGAGNDAFNCDIMELNAGRLNVAQIETGKIYSIIINGDKCFKNEYLGDDYSITGTAGPLIFVKFPNPNKTFSPRLKIQATYYDILRPESQAGSGIYRRVTIGYIDETKEYALIQKIISTPTGSKTFYIIQEKMTEIAETAIAGIDPKPKRTCMVDFSLNNNIDVMWSRPNSSCINQCPSYKDDPRVGAGRTNRGTDFIKWDRANFGEDQIKKFDGTTKNLDGSYEEINTELNPTNFQRDRANTHFVLLRKCGPNGVWESQVYDLCVTSGGTDSSKVPATGINSFITAGSGRITKGTEKFAVAANNEEVITSCLTGFEPQTDEQTYTGNTLPRLKYTCVINSSNDNKAEFHPVPTTFDCVKYCSTAPSELSGGAFGRISVTGSIVKVRAMEDEIKNSEGNVKVKSNGLQDVSCASGFVQKRTGGTGARDIAPKLLCTKVANSDTVSWSVSEDCEPAAKCFITANEGTIVDAGGETSTCWTSENDYENSEGDPIIVRGRDCPESYPFNASASGGDYYGWQDPDNKWFPLSKYIKSAHRTGGMFHGIQLKETFAPDSTSEATKYGKCGYCASWYKHSGWLAGDNGISFRRKYLKSYYCNDGVWVADWENSDANYNSACNGQGEIRDIVTRDRVNETEIPQSSYLGKCTTDKAEAGSYNNLP